MNSRSNLLVPWSRLDYLGSYHHRVVFISARVAKKGGSYAFFQNEHMDYGLWMLNLVSMAIVGFVVSHPGDLSPIAPKLVGRCARSHPILAQPLAFLLFKSRRIVNMDRESCLSNLE